MLFKRIVMANTKSAESEENGRVENKRDDAWRPPGELVIKSLLAVRLFSAIFGVISYSNDEVFNNWEPLHMLIHGVGFQTLEFSPTVANGSYFFLSPYYYWSYFFASQAFFSKIAQFMMVRLLVGGFCLGGEYYAYSVICDRINISTGKLFLFFSIFSAGMFQESVKFSQPSFGMSCLFYFLGSYLTENWTLSVIFTTLTIFTGCTLNSMFLFVIFIMCIMRERVQRFLASLTVTVPIVLALRITVDSFYYGKVVGPWYEHYLSVDELLEMHGKASRVIHFYLLNIGTNWNIAVIVACLSVIPVLIHAVRGPKKESPRLWLDKTRTHVLLLVLMYFTVLYVLVSALLNLDVSMMASIYPFVALFAALACDEFLQLMSRKKLSYGVVCSVLFSYALLSGMRITSLIEGYGAHIEIYNSFNKELFAHQVFDGFNNPIRLCTGKEWHRFPSSFFIPDEAFDGSAQTRPIEMSFTQSNYHGLSPSKFLKLNRTIYINDDRIEITRHVEPDIRFFKTEDSTYDSVDSCDYFIDVDYPANGKEQNLKEMPEHWKPIESRRVMNRQSSLFFWRTFFVPVPVPGYVEWTNCTLYRRIRY